MSSGGDDRTTRPSTGMRRREVIAAIGASLMAASVGSQALAKSQPQVPSGDAAEAERYRRERKYARTRFGRIAYVERGRGAAALLLHGFPLNGFQWRGVIPRLCAQRRCLAPDFLGLGFTVWFRVRRVQGWPCAHIG